MAIYGTLDTCAAQTRGFSHFDVAIRFLQDVLSGRHPASQQLRRLDEGKVERIDLQGDDVYALLQHPRTKPRADQQMEAHRRYADVQAVIEGDEILELTPLEGLATTLPYDAARDVSLHPMPAQGSRLVMRPGLAAVLFPPDGHAPLQAPDGTPHPSRRIVVKVRVAD